MGEIRERMLEDLTMRGLSEATRESCLAYARAFVAHFRRSPHELGADHVRAWILHLLTAAGRSAATVNVAIAALRFLFRTTLRRPEVMQEIRTVRRHHKSVEVPSGQEMERLFSNTTDVRQRAMFMLLYGAGLRVSELVGLMPRDIDSQRMVVVVRDTKTRHDRLAPLTPRMLDALRVYFRERRPKEYLFPGPSGKGPLNRSTVAFQLRKAAAQAGLAKPFYPHLLRHAFATHMVELGVDLRSVQILLGHRSIQSTTRYTQLTEARRHSLSNPVEALGTEQGKLLG